MELDRGALEGVYAALLTHHGPQGWWPAESDFEVVVGAVLIQRTAWRNAEQGLAALRAAGLLTADALAASSARRIEALVRPAGFYRQKAARLSAVARWLVARGSLARLAELADDELEAAWLALPGIGPETAAVICLYAFGRPLFVVDAYARRTFARLGWIGGDEPGPTLRRACEQALDANAATYNEYHALIVAHAKTHCRPTPRCAGCPLLRYCAHPAGTASR